MFKKLYILLSYYFWKKKKMGIKYELQWFIYSKGQIRYWVAALINIYSWRPNKNMGGGVSILSLFLNPQWNMQDNIKIRFAPFASWLGLSFGNIFDGKQKVRRNVAFSVEQIQTYWTSFLRKRVKKKLQRLCYCKQEVMIIGSCKSSSFLFIFFTFLFYNIRELHLD